MIAGGAYSEPWNVVGHEAAIHFLQQAVFSERLSHAYLFVGPRQVGKRTIASELARMALCQGDSRPCGACRPCQLFARGVHPDVSVVRGDRAKGMIGVEQIRALRREASLAPMESRQKVFILCGMELANEHASNALLKILEEPPSYVMFLLTATAEELVLPTILSRCQVVPLRSLPRETIRDALVARWGAEPTQAELLAHLSGGCMGRAIDLVRAGDAPLQRREEIVQRLVTVLGASSAERFEWAGRVRSDELSAILETWLIWWRDVLLFQQGLGERVTDCDRRDELAWAAGVFSTPQVHASLTALQTCADALQKNVNSRLALEWLLLRLPGARKVAV